MRYLLLTLAVFALLPASAAAQKAWYRGNVTQTIKNIETNADKYKRSMDRALDKSVINGTKLEDDINNFIKDFEKATDELRSRSQDREFAPGAAREVLVRGKVIDVFMKKHPPHNRRAENDWARVRSSLNTLAWAYYITWNWN